MHTEHQTKCLAQCQENVHVLYGSYHIRLHPRDSANSSYYTEKIGTEYSCFYWKGKSDAYFFSRVGDCEEKIVTVK